MPDSNWFVSALGFALASSISPGPVNLLTLSTILHGRLRNGWLLISGATVGFVAQLLLLGLGLQTLLTAWPPLAQLLHWGGVAFLLWMAWVLWFADTAIGGSVRQRAGFAYGAVLQWLNPKAYLAVAAAVGLYVGDTSAHLYWLAAIYTAVCWLSLAAWVGLGLLLRRHALRHPHLLTGLNRCLSGTLLLSVVLMLV